MCIHSQNLNKIPLLLVTARLLARLNNTNGWSPVTFLDTASPFTQSQCLRMLAGWQLPWSPLGCWCLESQPLLKRGPNAGWMSCVTAWCRAGHGGAIRSHQSRCERGVWGWWATSWFVGFFSQKKPSLLGFYDPGLLSLLNPLSWMHLSQISGV